jgi:hemolysin III
MTLIGSILKIFYANRFKVFSTLIYVIMGWMAILIINPLIERVGEATLYWIIIGGVSYTIGVIFYLRESIKYNHAIWHVFVLGGTLSHFIAVWCCLE